MVMHGYPCISMYILHKPLFRICATIVVHTYSARMPMIMSQQLSDGTDLMKNGTI